MFGVDKKGNYGPLSLHDYSDDSDDENDFVSEQIRNQRVSQVVGQVCFVGFSSIWPSGRGCRYWPRCIRLRNVTLRKQRRRKEIRDQILCRFVPDSQDCCGEVLRSIGPPLN